MCFDGCFALCDRLRRNDPCLTVLDLSHKFMGNDGAKALASALQCNTHVVVLFLQHNHLGPAAARSLASVLSHHPRLAHLYLDDNHIGDEGCQAIAQLLQTSKTLQVLKLSDNQIGVQGARTIASALSYTSSLQYLSLHKNCLREGGIQVICDALGGGQEHSTAPTLRWLDLRCNKVQNPKPVLQAWIDILRDRPHNCIPNETLCILELWESSEHTFVQQSCGEDVNRLDFWLKWNRAGRRSLRDATEDLPLCRLLANSSASPAVLMASLVMRPDLVSK
jgi:hypothetical protein